MPKPGTPLRDDAEIARLKRAVAELERQLAARSRELQEAREQQTVTAEILHTISGAPTDPGPVLETILANAARLCEAHTACVFLNVDGRLELAAHTPCTPAYADFLRRGRLGFDFGWVPDRTRTTGRAALDRRTVQILDIQAELGVAPAHCIEGVRTVLAVPMCRGDVLVGVLSIWRREVRAFSDGQIRLLETLASQAVIAIENVRLFDEIQEKSRQLELANTYRSRFFAAASHDLRQPLHALNLFVGQLQTEPHAGERQRLVARIEAAVQAMNELFNALLDVSRLDAGVLEAKPTMFPVAQILSRVETTFAEAAREKGLRFKVVPSAAWVRSDFILLERILFNLVSNAVRYTTLGGIVVGARRRGERLWLEVWDSGPGIPEDQRQEIFTEFYQFASPGQDRRGGLGLGLAIVDRLGRLLDHPVELTSRRGKGSRFAISVPHVPGDVPVEVPHSPAVIADPIRGKLIVVIDDDALVLEGMCGTLHSWGCQVVAADSDAAALARVREVGRTPDVIISDYRLAAGQTGIQAIERLCAALGRKLPAFLVSGDTAPERLREASARGYHLLHKPVPPMALRALLNRHLTAGDGTRTTTPAA